MRCSAQPRLLVYAFDWKKWKCMITMNFLFKLHGWPVWAGRRAAHRMAPLLIIINSTPHRPVAWLTLDSQWKKSVHTTSRTTYRTHLLSTFCGNELSGRQIYHLVRAAAWRRARPGRQKHICSLCSVILITESVTRHNGTKEKIKGLITITRSDRYMEATWLWSLQGRPAWVSRWTIRRLQVFGVPGSWGLRLCNPDQVLGVRRGRPRGSIVHLIIPLERFSPDTRIRNSSLLIWRAMRILRERLRYKKWH